MPYSPSALGEDALQDKRQLLTTMYMTHKSYFLRTANAILHSDADAEDALQSCFCSAWNAMSNFRGDSSLKTWFTRIVVNRSLVMLRQRRSDKVAFLEDDPDSLAAFEYRMAADSLTPEHLLLHSETATQLQKGLNKLSPDARQTLELYYLQELTIDEIATAGCVSVTAVKSRLCRGRDRLKKQLSYQAPLRTQPAYSPDQGTAKKLLQ